MSGIERLRAAQEERWLDRGRRLVFHPPVMPLPYVIRAAAGESRFPRSEDATAGVAATRSDGSRYFNPDVDVVVYMPTQELAPTETGHVLGGRHIRVIGGKLIRGGSQSSMFAVGTQAGSAFIEGMHIDCGGAQCDAFAVRWNATVAGPTDMNLPITTYPGLTVQNCRFMGINGDPDATHGDGVQDQTGEGSDHIRLEQVTIESSYQGIFILTGPVPKEGPRNGLWLRKVNTKLYVGGARDWVISYYFHDQSAGGPTSLLYPVHLDQVYGGLSNSGTWQNHVCTPNATNTWGPVMQTDAQGDFLDFSALGLQMTGRVRKGQPPGGDFATAESTGLNYRSPWLVPVGMPTTYYVDQSIGVDGAGVSGSQGTPWATITYGASRLARGDILLVKNGTYTGLWAFGLPAAGYSWDLPTTIKAYPGHSPIITAAAGAHAVRFVGTSYVVFDGFVIDAAGGIEGIKITTGTGSSYADHIRVMNCEIMNAPENGILNQGPYCEFLYNLIHDNGSPALTDFRHGIYNEEEHCLFEGNEIYDNFGWGIHSYSVTAGRVHDSAAIGNFCHDNAAFGARGPGILMSGPRNRVINNICARNAGGIQLEHNDPREDEVYNNTIYDNNRNEVKPGIIIAGAPNCIVGNNIIFGHATPIEDDSASTQFNNLTTDPDFIGATLATPVEFRPQLGSPARNAGAAIAAVTTDFVGIARPQHGSYDIGAHESTWLEVGSGANLRFEGGALKVALGGNVSHYMWRAQTVPNDVWVQFQVAVPTYVDHGDQGVFGITTPGGTSPSTNILGLEVLQLLSGGVGQFRFRLSTRNDAGTFSGISTGVQGQPPQSILVQLRWVRATAPGANDGRVELYLAGSPTVAAEITGIDNDAMAGISRMHVGAAFSLRTHTPYDITLDGMLVGTTRGAADIWDGDF